MAMSVVVVVGEFVMTEIVRTTNNSNWLHIMRRLLSPAFVAASSVWCSEVISTLTFFK